MVLSTPELPALQRIPIYVGVNSLLAFCVSKMHGGVDTSMAVTVFAVWALAVPLIYHLIESGAERYYGNPDSLRSHKIFLFTSLVIGSISVIALKELGLVGDLFNALLGLFVLGRAVYRVMYIDEQERLSLTHSGG